MVSWLQECQHIEKSAHSIVTRDKYERITSQELHHQGSGRSMTLYTFTRTYDRCTRLVHHTV
jgi:hypothetical protein